MGAGLASSTISGVNVNQVQFGDKLQGLAPQATHFFIAGNGKAGWNQYRTRTNGNKRNFVFCMNQLGGVGASRSQFKIRGLNKPDGARKCAPHRYTLCLVGVHEKLLSDFSGCDCIQESSVAGFYPFVHLTDEAPCASELSHLPAGVMEQLRTASQNSSVRRKIVAVIRLFHSITAKGCTGIALGPTYALVTQVYQVKLSTIRPTITSSAVPRVRTTPKTKIGRHNVAPYWQPSLLVERVFWWEWFTPASPPSRLPPA